jgi:hypothetical protein
MVANGDGSVLASELGTVDRYVEHMSQTSAHR